MDAKIESELIDLPEDEARELLESIGQPEPGLQPADPGRLRHAGPADLPDRRAEGGARLDHPDRRHRARGRRRHPHRLPARLHQGRGRLLRRPDRGRLDGRGEGGRQGAHRGQGVRHARRRRRGVPLQRLGEALSRHLTCGNAVKIPLLGAPCADPLPASRRSARQRPLRVRSSAVGHKCEYVFGVTVALAWPSAR